MIEQVNVWSSVCTGRTGNIGEGDDMESVERAGVCGAETETLSHVGAPPTARRRLAGADQ